MKAMMAAVFVLLAMTGSADAVTLHATGGLLGEEEFVFETGLNIFGDGWAMDGYRATARASLFRFGVPSVSFDFLTAHVTLLGLTFTDDADISFGTNNSSATVFNQPLVPQPTPLTDQGLAAPGVHSYIAGTFTMLGHAGFPDGGFDFDGSGWIEVFGITNTPLLNFEITRVTYFVAEPSSAEMLGAAVLVLMFVWAARHRSGLLFRGDRRG